MHCTFALLLNLVETLKVEWWNNANAKRLQHWITPANPTSRKTAIYVTKRRERFQQQQSKQETRAYYLCYELIKPLCGIVCKFSSCISLIIVNTSIDTIWSAIKTQWDMSTREWVRVKSVNSNFNVQNFQLLSENVAKIEFAYFRERATPLLQHLIFRKTWSIGWNRRNIFHFIHLPRGEAFF